MTIFSKNERYSKYPYPPPSRLILTQSNYINQITLLYFASIKTSLPNSPSSQLLTLPYVPFPLSQLRALLSSEYPGNEELIMVLKKSAWCVEEEMIGRDEEENVMLMGGETVCGIPPVSGG